MNEQKFYEWLRNQPKAVEEFENIKSEVNSISPKFKRARNKKWRNKRIEFESKWIDIYLKENKPIYEKS